MLLILYMLFLYVIVFTYFPIYIYIVFPLCYNIDMIQVFTFRLLILISFFQKDQAGGLNFNTDHTCKQIQANALYTP